jgi:hypothetical protein
MELYNFTSMLIIDQVILAGLLSVTRVSILLLRLDLVQAVEVSLLVGQSIISLGRPQDLS